MSNELKKEKEKKEESVANKKSSTSTKRTKVAAPKKEKPTKEKKVIPKRAAGDDLEPVRKKQKAMLDIINSVELLSGEQQEQFLLAVAMGLVPDKFGLEAGLDTRLKALDQLQKIQANKLKNGSESNDGEGVVITDDIS